MAKKILDLSNTKIEVIYENWDTDPVKSHRCSVSTKVSLNSLKSVSIREQSLNYPRNGGNIFELSHHDNILNPIIPSAILNGENYIVLENFEYSLDKKFVPPNLKELTQQIFNGLHHFHKSGLVLGSISASNIVWCAVKDGVDSKSQFKITNIANDVYYLKENPNLEQENVIDLARVLLTFYNNILEKNSSKLSEHDKTCFLDLIEMMEKGQKMQMNLKHPYLWSIHESLMFIVEIAKIMELYEKFGSCNDFIESLKFSQENILDEKRWKHLASDLVGYLSKKFNCNTYNDIFGLIRTIRNMVNN